MPEYRTPITPDQERSDLENGLQAKIDAATVALSTFMHDMCKIARLSRACAESGVVELRREISGLHDKRATDAATVTDWMRKIDDDNTLRTQKNNLLWEKCTHALEKHREEINALTVEVRSQKRVLDAMLYTPPAKKKARRGRGGR